MAVSVNPALYPSYALFDFTYRARLTNAVPVSGHAALGATARVITHSPATQIVDGELTFRRRAGRTQHAEPRYSRPPS